MPCIAIQQIVAASECRQQSTSRDRRSKPRVISRVTNLDRHKSHMGVLALRYANGLRCSRSTAELVILISFWALYNTALKR